MSSSSNYLVPTADRSYVSVEGLPGVGFKPMNTLDDPRIWSAVIRVDAGQNLPARRNTALAEYLVVRGSGRYIGGLSFAAGDYLREEAGDYELIEARDELVFFVTHHGECSYLQPDESACVELGIESLRDMQRDQ